MVRGFLKLGGLVRISRRAERLLIEPVDGASVDGEILDPRELVEEIWREYGKSALDRGASMLRDQALSVIGLPVEITSSHFLNELYRPHGFSALLATRLQEEISDGETRLVRLPITAGGPGKLSDRFEALGQPSSVWRGWFGFVVGIVAVAANIPRLPSSAGGSRPPSGGWIAAVFGDKGTHSTHVWKWLTRKRDNTVLVLGHKPLNADLRQMAEEYGVKVIYPLRLSDVPASVVRLTCCWGNLLKVHSKAERDLGIRCGIRFHMRAAAWFFRGFLHQAWIRDAKLHTTSRVVFGLIAHADSRIADYTFREQGLETTHWLHGVVEDALHFRAHSSVCLCSTPNDAQLRREYGCYGRCVCPLPPETSVQALKSGREGVLVVTNLIHPDNRFLHYGAADALENLLHIVGSLKELGGSIVWRPHPRESKGPLFAQFERIASRLGIVIDNETPLAAQIAAFRRTLATPSTAIAALAGSGRVPAIFDVLPFDKEGYVGRLPDALTFRNQLELRQVFDSLEDDAFRQQMLDNLRREFPGHSPTPDDL